MKVLQHLALFSAQVAVLALLAFVLIQVLRAWLTPRARCWIWGLVVLRLCLPVSLDAPFSVFNLLKPALAARAPSPLPAPVEPVRHATTTTAPQPLLPQSSPVPFPSAAPFPPSATVDVAPPVQTFALAASTPPATPIPWTRIAFLVWAAGAITLLGRTAWLALRMHRTVASGRPDSSPSLASALDQARLLTGVRTPIRVVVLHGIDSPALYGFLRPTLLVPPDLERILEPSQLRHVLLHECAHVRRRDIALNWLMAVLQALHWFNPAVWLAFARLRAERELACDEIALEASGKDESEAYGRTLLHLLTSWSDVAPLPTPGAIGLLERHGDLRRRLRHIADFRPGRRLGIPVALLIAMAGAVTLTDAQSPSATNAPASASQPTNLPPVVPLRYTNAFTAPENKDLQSGGNWAKAPRGSNILGGVHFEIDGLLQLASKSSAGYKRDFREFVTLNVPTNRYGSVHLLATAAWSSEPNRRIADVIWRYTDGTTKRSPILYTGHVRDWWRRPFEEPHQVYSKFARCAVTWSSPDAVKNKAALRAYRVSLANPDPTKPVAFLQLQSAMEDSSLLVLGVSLDPLELGKRPDPSPDAEPEDPKWTRHLGVTVIDAGTSNVVGGARIKASVSTGSFSADREYTGNGSGVADVLLPDETITEVTVEASATDYSTTKHRFAFSGTNPVPAFVTVRLHGGTTIGGIVLNKAGDPVAGAEVEVYRFWTGSDAMGQPGEDSGFGNKKAKTGADGRWEVSAVPKHRFNRIGISVSHDDYVKVSISPIAQDAAVEAALVGKQHEIRLMSAIFVSGLVLNPDGQAVPNADVRVGRRFSGNDREARTDASGRFRIGGQQAGETVVTARAKGYGAAGEKVTISEKTPQITLTLKPARLFSGVVTDADNQPIPDVWLAVDTVHGPDADELANEFTEFTARTASDGTWSWESGPEMEMQFRFQKDGFAGKSGVRIKPDQPATVVLNKPREVEGIVLDAESGEPVKEFRLEPRGNWWSNSDARSFSAPNGRFTFSLPQDHYDRFHVTSANHEPNEELIPAAVNGVIQMTIRVKPAEDWSGIVVDAAGNPAAGVTVAVAGIGENLNLQGDRLDSWREGTVFTSGPDGSFKLNPVQQPNAVVAAGPAGFGLSTVEEFRQTRRVRLLPFGALQGTYRGPVDATEGANGGAKLTLQLFAGSGQGYIGISGSWGGLQSSLSSGGTFHYTRVPAGSHQLVRLIKAAANSWAHRPIQDVVIEPGQTATVDVTVEGSRVIGQLVLGEAARIPGMQWQVGIATASRWKPNPSMSPEEIQKLVQDPEFQKAMQRMRHYQCTYRPDGTFEGQDVPAGTYDLTAVGYVLKDGQASQAWNATKSFTIPEGSAPDSILDLGAITLTPAPVPGK
jgi:beta-lactamase regulating signal transducer with metallopeptidase domain